MYYENKQISFTNIFPINPIIKFTLPITRFSIIKNTFTNNKILYQTIIKKISYRGKITKQTLTLIKGQIYQSYFLKILYIFSIPRLRRINEKYHFTLKDRRIEYYFIPLSYTLKIQELIIFILKYYALRKIIYRKNLNLNYKKKIKFKFKLHKN